MIKELAVIHPIVESRLKQLGWTYIHETAVSYSGGQRVDFLAFNGTRYLVIECKRDCDDLHNAIRQVWRYVSLIQNTPNSYFDWLENDLRCDERCSQFILSARYAYYKAMPCIVVPSYACTKQDYDLCKRHGVTLMTCKVLPETAREASQTFLKPRR